MDFFLGLALTFLLGVASLIALSVIHMIFNPADFVQLVDGPDTSKMGKGE